MQNDLCQENPTPLNSRVSEVKAEVQEKLPLQNLMVRSEADLEEEKRKKRREAVRRWAAKNKDDLRRRAKLRWKNDRKRQSERHREWRLKNKSKRCESAKRYRKHHPELVKAAMKAWYENNKDYVAEYTKKRYEKIKDDPDYKLKAKLYHAKLYVETKPEIVARVKKWRAANPGKVRAIARRCAKRHPESGRARGALRRARKKGAWTGDVRVNSLIKQWRKSRFFQCYYCGNRFGIKKMHIDHKVPIAKGGKHSCDNICRACSSCNVRKHDKPVNGFPGQMLLIQ